MDNKVLDFLQNQRVSVLGILQTNKTVHSATLHFAYSSEPLAFYFITEKESRKCKSLLDNKSHNASLVIGFSEEEFTTFQCQGTVQIVSNKSEQDIGWKIYGDKFPTRAKLQTDEDMVLLKFMPTWWKYTNLKTKTKISSED